MANSVPVAIASDQSPVPVTLSSAPLPTNAATASNQTTQIGLETSTNTAVAALNSKGMAALFTLKYDELVITYVGASTDIDTVTSKLAGVTQQTLTLSYDGSDRLTGAVIV